MALRACRRFGIGILGLILLACAACHSFPHAEVDGCLEECGFHAASCRKDTMMALARDLDHLENHIERFGSVTTGKPTVWGQARLTQYREEFEAIMAKRKDEFLETLQGRSSYDDQAFLVQAMSLGLAASGSGAVRRVPAGTYTADSKSEVKNITLIEPPDAPLPTVKIKTSAGEKDVEIISSPTFRDPRLSDPNAFRPAFTASLKQGQKDITTLQIALEPTIVLEQQARYLNYLNQIRRTNEGDDTADSPGYSLNLVRIPVSVLPGHRTRKGFGAEVTLTLEPILGDELLPTTFRNLVVNDLADQIGLPLASVLNDRELAQTLLTEDNWCALIRNDPDLSYLDLPCLQEEGPHPKRYPPKEGLQGLNKLKTPPPPTRVPAFYQFSVTVQGKKETGRNALAKVVEKFSPPALPSTKVRAARHPFPPSQLFDIYGLEFPFILAWDARRTFERENHREGGVHLPDVQGYLKEELVAAFEFLRVPGNRDLWELCGPQLAEAVRARRIDAVEMVRKNFHELVKQRLGEVTKDGLGSFKKAAHGTTIALAWAILVESALLNEHLVQDMKETASAKGVVLPDAWLPYFLPEPPPEARQAFNDYVRLRWPIHVFALDPITQDQNLADSATRRRETQLALSLAFASGRMTARSFTRYARRIDAEFDTIALNRTAVGFSHGADTFGWRFYPRFQTPPPRGNATTFFRDLVIGGPSRDQDLASRQLEPGMRECVAIVLMPAFVPYLTCDVATNWFELTDPKCKVMDTTQALRLSKTVKAIQVCGPDVRDMDCYRDGDFGRLLRKADQLAARLPLQTHQLLVPFENTLGGFQMFSTGVTDLAPELTGWYGAPGIHPREDTALFLVGDHFSVKHTRVVAGGRTIDTTQSGRQELLSRQVMRVVIPAGTQPTAPDKEGRQYVDVHLATPYGVTQHLLIPVLGARNSGFAFYPRPTLKATLKHQAGRITEFAFLDPPVKVLSILNNSQQPHVDFSAGKLVLSAGMLTTSGAVRNFGDLPSLELTVAGNLSTVALDDVRKLLQERLAGMDLPSAKATTLNLSARIVVNQGGTEAYSLDNSLEVAVEPIEVSAKKE